MTRLYLNMWTLQLVTKSGRPAPTPPSRAELQQRARSAAAMRQAKALAKTCGVEIEREDAGAYWVTHDAFTDTDDDPLEGSHFCSDGAEVLEAVRIYAEAVAKKAEAPAA